MDDGEVKQTKGGFVKAIDIIISGILEYKLGNNNNYYFSILFHPHHPELFLLDDRQCNTEWTNKVL